MAIDRNQLERRLAAAFDATPAQCRVVARQAVDLADSGQYASDLGFELTIDHILHELADAPDEPLPDRWNWWIGSLELAYGGYEAFGIRQYRSDG